MADYTPYMKPGKNPTLTVGATAVVGGNLVMLSAAKTVIPTTGATNAWIGVAVQDAAIGAKVHTTSGGIQELVANGAVAAGADVGAAAAGKCTTIAAQTAFQRVGLALTAAAADGDKILVLMDR